VFLDIDKTEYGRDALRQIGRECCTSDTHVHDDDQKKVKKDIEHGREDQKIEWNLTISDRTKERGKQVIEHTCCQAETYDCNIGIRILKDIVRCVH